MCCEYIRINQTYISLHAVYITPQLPISNEKSAPKLRQVQRSVAFIVQDLLNRSASAHSYDTILIYIRTELFLERLK